ncbi:MAG: cbb3-type cytochrome c oxidase subunit 3 [Gammaproteobacteria bacterium]|nr:cbb3-type cytochrome c oxidase subunit 3 [Gammaproteobacteria bacterium]
MTQLILAGDLLVCAFMVGLAAWLLTRGGKEKSEAAAQIPLQDEVPAAPGNPNVPGNDAAPGQPAANPVASTKESPGASPR